MGSRRRVEVEGVLSVPIRCRDFVGRAPELEHLLARRRDAGERRGGAVLISGEAGLGKSRLVDEFVAASVRSTARIVRAECREFAQSPFGPLADILDGLREPSAFLRESSSEEAQLEGLVATLARVSDRRTTVVVLEDLHWANPVLVLALRVLAMRATSQRTLFVATYRDNEIVPGHPNFVALGKLLRERSVSRVALGPLAGEEIVELLRRALGDTVVPHVVVADVASRSDGNPLFGEELLRHTVDAIGRTGASRASGVPISLQAIVQERIERCTPREREILALAAIFNRSFGPGEIAAVAEGGAEPTALELDALVDYQLLTRDEATGRFAFRHALTRDAMYGNIPERIAKPIHARIARALEARSAPPAGAEPAAAAAAPPLVEIAYHRWQSGDRASAAPACEAAGTLARAQFAYADSIEWFERAIAGFAGSEPDVARVRLALGRVLIAVHERERGLAEYEKVVAWARRGDTDLFVRARKLMAGYIANDGGRDRAIALLEETVAALDPQTSAETIAELTLRITSYLLMKDDPSEARASLARLDPRALGPASRPEFYTLRSAVHAREPASDAAWRADAERAIEGYVALGAPAFALYASAMFASQALSRGDLALARASLERAATLGGESASNFNQLPVSFAQLELAAGRYAEARAWIDRVRPSSQLISRWMEALVRTELALARDDVAELERRVDLALIDELERNDERQGAFRLGTAYALAVARLGRRAEGERLLERVMPRAGADLQPIATILAAATLSPGLTLRYAEPARAAGTPFLAAAATMLEAEAQTLTAPAMLLLAARYYEESGWHVLAARAAELAGDVTAAERYRTIGNVAGVHRLGAIDFRSDPVAPVAGDRTGQLSAREREIAHLIAAGRSNREAASALSISDKTVEKYLTSIYLKLGLSSRAQLAAYVTSAREPTA